MRQANPELKDYCFQKHGLDFSMVDMRWGVTDEATNDHSTEEICLREIHNCQRVGLGPTFVVRYVLSIQGTMYKLDCIEFDPDLKLY